jgi:hypothetical protein
LLTTRMNCQVLGPPWFSRLKISSNARDKWYIYLGLISHQANVQA